MDNWYNNKDLFEKMTELDNKIDCLQRDLESTRTLIRDYNNLRQKVEETAVKINTLMWMTPIAIAAMGLLFTVLSFILG